MSSFALFLAGAVAAAEPPGSTLGQERAVPRHLADSDRPPVGELLYHGRLLFQANWTDQDGGGRPQTKGTGRPLADPSKPLTGGRAFNRISAPDANSCFGCHNQPFGMSGGGGDFVTNVFVLGQRFDSVSLNAGTTLTESVGNVRSTTGMFGAGYLEMLARQMTAELQQIRGQIRMGETRELVAKGVHFGKLTLTREGLWDVSCVEGLSRLSLLSTGSHDPPSLVIRPWHQAGNVVSLREFSNNAFNHHHGMQATERFGEGTDPDQDGFTNELTRMDITAISLYQAALPAPGRVISRQPEIEKAVWNGEQRFAQIGCVRCHVPELALDAKGWLFTEPGPYNPAGNARTGDIPAVTLDLASDELPGPRLKPDANGIVRVPAYTDFKLHAIGDSEDGEPLDQNQSVWAAEFKQGNRMFLTKRLWGAANEPPYLHNGMVTTLRAAVLAHGGEALAERRAFQDLSEYDRNSVIEFLKTLQVLLPGTPHTIVDENYQPRPWPPKGLQP